MPADLGECLPSSFPYAAIPIQVWISPEGMSRGSLAFYDQCSGKTYAVPEPVQACLREKLSRWRWLVTTCGDDQTPRRDQEYLVQAVRPKRSVPKSLVQFPAWTRSYGCVGT
jgi:hypothetical protein